MSGVLYESVHPAVLSDGSRCDVLIRADDDVCVFETSPQLAPDLARRGLRGARRTVVYRIEGGRLWLEEIRGEFRRPFFSRLPLYAGVRAVRSCTVPLQPPCENRRMWQYNLMQPSDFTGSMLVGRDFDMRLWPKDEHAQSVPCCPEAYRTLARWYFADGCLTACEPVLRQPAND